MFRPRMIVIHCSATKEGVNIGAKDIDKWHKQRGFRCIGYHYVIRLDGTIETGRPISEVGAHAKGFNSTSIGVCYVGGLDKSGKPKDTRTILQIESMDRLLNRLCDSKDYTIEKIVGHRDLSKDLNGDGVITSNEWMKSCPCFEVKDRYESFLSEVLVKWRKS